MGLIKYVDKEDESCFARLPNDLLRDKTLSWTAIGLLAHIHSHKAGFNITIESLARASKSGVTATRSAVNELRKAGYLHFAGRELEAGKYTSSIWNVYLTPIEPDCSYVENPTKEIPSEERTHVNKEDYPKKTNKSINAKQKKVKERNPLLDVFANEWYPDGIVPPRFWSKAATALSEIKEVEPDVTPERLREEIKAIRPQFTTSGPLAISGHWREYTQKKLKAKEDPLEIRYKALFSALIAFKQSGGEGLTVRQKEICAKITDYCTMRDLQLDKIMVDKEQLLGVYNEIIS